MTSGAVVAVNALGNADTSRRRSWARNPDTGTLRGPIDRLRDRSTERTRGSLTGAPHVAGIEARWPVMPDHAHHERLQPIALVFLIAAVLACISLTAPAQAQPTEAPTGTVVGSSAHAAITGPSETTDNADDSDEDSELMLVMDSSGSMAEPAGGGVSKIEAARESLHTVIDTLPSDQPLGLRVYGAQIPGESDPNACTDSQLVVEPGSDNRDELHQAVGSYEPKGATPIGYALQQAGYDLGGKGRRNIILVSDGESTCQPDPCTVSRQLRNEGIDLRIDVVGLNVSGTARKQLQCVAESGGGIYYDAQDPDQLTDSLTTLTERAARPYEVIGNPVTGGKNWADAPTIGEGDWVDEIAPSHSYDGGNLVYRIERSLANSTMFVSAAFRAPDGSSNVDLTLSTPDGYECDASFDSQLFTDGMLLSVGGTVGPLGEENEPRAADDPCQTSRYLAATISYSDNDHAVPVELRVSETPEITNLDDLPEPTATPDWESPEADTTEVTGGTSFGDAEELEPGGYAGTIVPGETITYAVDVGWGEQLNVAAHLDDLSGALTQAVAGDPSIYMQVFGPSRLSAGTTEATTDLASDATLGDGGSDELGLTTGPVTYTNVGYNTGAAEAGTYTVTLYLEDNDENASLPVPYNLGIDITGEPASAPDFDEQDIDTATTDTADATGDDSEAAAPPPSTDDSDGGVSKWDWIIGLALLAAVALALLRLRHRPATTGGTAADDITDRAPSIPNLNLSGLASRARSLTDQLRQHLPTNQTGRRPANLPDPYADRSTPPAPWPRPPMPTGQQGHGDELIPIGEPDTHPAPTAPTPPAHASGAARDGRTHSDDRVGAIEPRPETAHPRADSAGDVGGRAAHAPLRLRLFGSLQLAWRTGAQDVDLTSELTDGQKDLLCFIALEPDGARRDILVATLWPESPPDQRGNGLRLATGRLRGSLAAATGGHVQDPFVISDGRYRLNPALFTVDYWTFVRAQRAGRSASTDTQRRTAFEHVIATYTGELAEDITADWINTSRQEAKLNAINAASRLAELLADTEPDRALEALETALTFEPANEPVYCDIMRLQARMGRASAIRPTLDLLTARLAENGDQPGPDTIALAERLAQRGGHDQRHGR